MSIGVPMRSRSNVDGWRIAVVGNLLLIIPLTYATGLHFFAPDHYYAAVQEDEYVELSSFWAFLLAGLMFVGVALVERRNGRRLPWFALGLSLFCVFVAMEEISWGQRLIGYRPPTYFLERNYQQEFNAHNVLATRYRQLAMQVVIGGYGILLPLMALLRVAQQPFERLGAVTPPLMFLPAFAVMLSAYVGYALEHTGEWIEVMLGLGFLLTADVRLHALRTRQWRSAPPTSVTLRFLGLWVLVVGLGLSSAAAARLIAADSPQLVEAARIETDALRHDFEAGLAHTRCGLHKRLFTFVEQYDQSGLRKGEFAALAAQVAKERVEFFLDPWNSPYWIRHSCAEAGTASIVFLYSFGPNRRRDSTDRAIGGDDIGWTMQPHALAVE